MSDNERSERGPRAVNKRTHPIVKVGRALAIAALAAQSACAVPAPTEPQPGGEATKTPTTEVSGTKIVPTEVSGVIVTEQSYMPQADVLKDPSIAAAFQAFQDVKKKDNPNDTFAAWGALAQTNTGPLFTPFFEVISPDGTLVEENVVALKSDNSIAYFPLQRVEVTGPDGRTYFTLSKMVDTDTGLLLANPEPYIWALKVPPEQQANSIIYFSVVPGIVPEEKAPLYQGANKVSLIRLVATPTPEIPTVVPTQDVLSGLSPEIQEWFRAKPDFSWQDKALVYKTAAGEAVQLPVQLNSDGTVTIEVEGNTISGKLETKNGGHILIRTEDGQTFTIENGVLEKVYIGLGEGVFITDTEIKSLATRMSCDSVFPDSVVGCFQKDPTKYSFGEADMKFYSTGEAEEITIVDPDTGRKVILTLLYIISQNGNKENNNFIIPFLAQAMFEGDTKVLGTNSDMLSYLGPLRYYPSEVEMNIPMSVDSINKIAPKGTLYIAGFPIVHPPNQSSALGGKEWISNYLFSQPSYAEAIAKFYRSFGSEIEKDFIINFTSWWDGGLW